MILFEEAYSKVIESAKLIGTEKVNIFDAINRILAEDIVSDIDMPPFNKSAVDGYACRRQDLKNNLEVIEIIPAGKQPEKEISSNQCAKIMTGGMMPKGADCVLMVEETKNIDATHIVFTSEQTRNNFAIKAEDIKVGQTLLNKGTILNSKHIPVLATAGYAEVKVARKLKIAILSTGDELVEPNEKPTASKIRNSNAYQLFAQTIESGAIPNYYGIAKDTKENTFELISKALNENDVVLLTGGVSMGDYDYVPDVMKQIGINILFQSIAIQPGKPTVFGTFKDKYIFGLPGNPVSSYMLFELLVKPLVFEVSGGKYHPLTVQMTMGLEYSRKRAERHSFIPVVIKKNGTVFPVEYHGSAHINSLTDAQGYITMEIGKTVISKGEIVDVRQF